MPERPLTTAWRLLKKAVVFELRLYRSLLRWILRRPHVPDGTTPVGYSRQVTPVMWLWIFGSAAELPLVHVLVPWEGVRIALLAVGVWGLVWMIGLLASLKVYPHLIGDDALRVRHGASVDIAVPWTDISSVAVHRRDLPSSARTLQPSESEHGTDLAVAVSGQVNVQLLLRTPITVPTGKGDLEVTRLGFLTDEPQDMAKRLRQHLATGTTADSTRTSAD